MLKRIQILFPLSTLLIVVGSCSNKTANDQDSNKSIVTQNPEEEIFYLIFPRSFYDSDGDKIGDLNGVVQKLDYLEELGITSIIMTPLYPSIYYHNYFADDFEGIDPEFGSLEDYQNMIHEIHKRGMKFYMDTEIQYVTKNHKWFKESYGNPNSKFSDYIFYNDSINKDPESIIFDLKGLESYNGDYLPITTVNLNNEEVKEYMRNLYAYWADPNQDGNFEDGVDGFRLDHMMDDLDYKKLLPNLFEGFWKPLIESVQEVNPNIKFIAEQADWGDPGVSYFSKADVDIVYAFWLIRPIGGGNNYANTLDTLLKLTPADKYQFLFLENHDLPRFANHVDFLQLGIEATKASAVSVLLNKGIPFIYYGQELGMKGDRIHGKNDGNDIPKREAFEWNKSIDAAGMALWYKDSGPWWDSTNLKSNDGISVEEQQDDPNSLLNFYKKLARLRKEHPGLSIGEEKVIRNKNPDILVYSRWYKNSRILIAVNRSHEPLSTEVSQESLPFDSSGSNWSLLFNDGASSINQSSVAINIKLAPFGFLIAGLSE